jgi:hypothetical protein
VANSQPATEHLKTGKVKEASLIFRCSTVGWRL